MLYMYMYFVVLLSASSMEYYKGNVQLHVQAMCMLQTHTHHHRPFTVHTTDTTDIPAPSSAVTVYPSTTSVLPTLVESPQPTSSSIWGIVAGAIAGVTLLAIVVVVVILAYCYLPVIRKRSRVVGNGVSVG